MKLAFGVTLGALLGMSAAVLMVHAGTSPLAAAWAQAGPAGGAGAGSPYVLGTGGSVPNQNDLCWILSKVKPAEGPERTVLLLYKAKDQGKHFDLEDARMIDADLRVVELEKDEHLKANTDFKTILRNLPKADQDQIAPRRP